MTYLMSDIHGEYDKFLDMLDEIGFDDEEDTLYILGDMIDRGEESVELLLDIADRPNVIPIMGNHEFTALYMLGELGDDMDIDSLPAEKLAALGLWLEDGGKPTFDGIMKLSPEDRRFVKMFLEDLPLYEAVDSEDASYILVHSGIGNFDPDKKLSEYTAEELAFTRVDPDTPCFDDESVFVVSGHTPTKLITGKNEIYRSGNNICIDCGATFGGRLGCLCLETDEEFYID